VPLSTYGDIGGFARIYRTGIVIFIAGSIACALSQSLTMLVASRCFQGIGAAAILATSQPITRFAFPRSMLGIAIGIQSLIVSVSTAAGPAIGGLILTFGTWPLLFWINVPFSLLSLALSGKLPDMPRATHRFDWFSAVFNCARRQTRSSSGSRWPARSSSARSSCAGKARSKCRSSRSISCRSASSGSR
jgi:DHA2 family multidrug resistance protein-like MFS transporter